MGHEGQPTQEDEGDGVGTGGVQAHVRRSGL